MTSYVDFIINITNQSHLATQKAQFALINDTISTTTIDDALDEMNISDDELKTKFPYLQQLGIPINQYSISTLLKEIVDLHRYLPKNNILHYNNYKVLCNIVSTIPVCKNGSSFARTNCAVGKWFDHLPSYIRGNNLDISDSEVAGCMIKQLATLHDDSFVNVSEELLGYSIGSKQMDIHTN